VSRPISLKVQRFESLLAAKYTWDSPFQPPSDLELPIYRAFTLSTKTASRKKYIRISRGTLVYFPRADRGSAKIHRGNF
jgi:hypothetical protein